MKPLPIDPLIPEVQKYFETGRSLILQAAPGAGKTTRVPPALLSVTEKDVVVLEPRRLAARLSAQRIAEELGEKTGETVGYQIRFDRVAGSLTRLLFITEGLFLRIAASDPALSRIGCVVLDEFHERHLHTDVALALTRHLQNTTRPDLKLVILSATLDIDALREYLPEAGYLLSEGREYPLAMRYTKLERIPLSAKVARAVKEIFAEPSLSGDVLVFLPGIGEIRKANDALRDIAGGCRIHQLHSSLPSSEEKEVFAPSEKRKIILSTNIAETSITIDGVTAVIDSGLARIPELAPWSGIQRLHVRPVSRASCIQRAGRAGRTAPGTVIRLYSKHDFESRPAQEKPEIQRLDLSHIVLDLKPVLGSFSINSLPWFSVPSASILKASEALLQVLGAVDSDGNLTITGKKMCALPLHPRLARSILEGEAQNLRSEMILAVSLLNEGMITKKTYEPGSITSSDILYQMKLFRMWQKGRIADSVDRSKARSVERLQRWLMGGIEPYGAEITEQKLAECLLTGFPDRVASVRRTDSGIHLMLCTGGTATLSRVSTVKESELILALEAEETRNYLSASGEIRIITATEIDRETLLSGPPQFVKEEAEYDWDSEMERARGVSKLRYGVLVLDESSIRQDDKQLSEILTQQISSRWPAPFKDDEEFRSLMRRIQLLKESGYAIEESHEPSEMLKELIEKIASGKSSFAEVKSRSLDDYFSEVISGKTLALLNKQAPQTVQLRSGRRVKVHYEYGKPPYISSWIQDFFGTYETPTIAAGRIPLVIHLLAPNRRAVQVTQDLSGFWKTHYPELRKQLSRRYPKHSWPEKP